MAGSMGTMTATGPGPRPGSSGLRPPRHHSNAFLPVALILSTFAHFGAFALLLMHPVMSQGPVYKVPVLVRLVELPAGSGGATTGTPGKTAESRPVVVPPPVRPKEPPKTTLPGKTPPPPREGPSPVDTGKAGQAVGLGKAGPAGLGGKGGAVILDEPTFQYEWYKARLEDLLKSNWRKPVLGNKSTVSASVHFTITANGQALDIQIVSSSGLPAFDQSVLRAVYGSAPFPRFPPQYTAPQLGVMYTFELLPEKQ